MNKNQYISLKNAVLDVILRDKSKEYNCHIKFVVEIALKLANEFKCDRQTVEIAALLHDIGRDQEKGAETHPEAGERIASKLIEEISPGLPEKEIILSCIRNHGSNGKSVEEKIIASADAASKVIYHLAFMLMCKKDTFEERAEWGLKYLEKGMKKISILSLRKQASSYYKEYRKIYKQVLL